MEASGTFAQDPGAESIRGYQGEDCDGRGERQTEVTAHDVGEKDMGGDEDNDGGKGWGTTGTRYICAQVHMQCNMSRDADYVAAVGDGSFGSMYCNSSEANAVGRDANAALTMGLCSTTSGKSEEPDIFIFDSDKGQWVEGEGDDEEADGDDLGEGDQRFRGYRVDWREEDDEQIITTGTLEKAEVDKYDGAFQKTKK